MKRRGICRFLSKAGFVVPFIPPFALACIWLFSLCAPPAVEKNYTVYDFPIPGSHTCISAKEWAGFRTSGVDFFFRDEENTEQFITGVDTNEYLPFADQAYHLTWGDKSLTIQYAYADSNGPWKEMQIDLSGFLG